MSLTCKMLQTMSNWEWYSNKELANNFWWRFGWRIFNLKKYWVEFEKKQWEWYIEYWRVISISENIKYKDRNSLKIIKLDLLERIYNFITK